jgi:carbonic anhydrase/acetyltransferase-like protein (isoleucine patch superfamily)
MKPTSDMREFEARVVRSLAAIPQVDPSAFVAPGADLMGHVVLEGHTSVWYRAVLRGDIEPIIVGEGSNVQDAAVLHTADGLPCRIGKRCTIGHAAIVHACAIGDETLIGMGAIILDGSEIGPHCIVGAAALVTQNTKIPEGSMVLGAPAKVIRPLTQEERDGIRILADRYQILAKHHRLSLSR